MACPKCGCKTVYQFDDEEDQQDDRRQRCAACGEVFDIDDLFKLAPLEERIYRFRCVEAWSMVIPWMGVPLATVIKRLQPKSSARYVQFLSLNDPTRMEGQRSAVLDWPYVEGLRIDEAMHPLTLLTLGLYGDLLPNQNGAPVRVTVPWKYGFKSAKSIVRQMSRSAPWISFCAWSRGSRPCPLRSGRNQRWLNASNDLPRRIPRSRK